MKSEIEKLASTEVEHLSIRKVEKESTILFSEDGTIRANHTSVVHGYMVEVMIDGHIGYAACSGADFTELKNTYEHAKKMASIFSKNKVFSFSKKEIRPPEKGTYQTQVISPFLKRDLAELEKKICEISKKIKSSQNILKARSFLQFETEKHQYWSLAGAEIEQNFSWVSSDFEATANQGSEVQSRTLSGFRGRTLQGGLEHFETPDLWDKVERVVSEANELVSAPQCPTGTMDLLLMPDQMMLQIHESIGHPLELDRILGDERNYAGFSFVRPNDFGSLQYGSTLLNVSFDPTLPHEVASFSFDDSGARAEKKMLIENGILKRGLGGLESQERLQMEGVSTMRACSWNRPPLDRMSNLNIEPGSSSLEEMISNTENGVLMTSNRSWSIDDYRNKFQFGCEYGKKIQDGKITGVVKNPNYRGITVPFWNSLTEVGSRDTFEVYGTPYCGKAEPNQTVYVGHAAPACRFKNIEIFGGV